MKCPVIIGTIMIYLELFVEDVESGPDLWGVHPVPAKVLGCRVRHVKRLPKVLGLGDVAQGREATLSHVELLGLEAHPESKKIYTVSMSSFFRSASKS